MYWDVLGCSIWLKPAALRFSVHRVSKSRKQPVDGKVSQEAAELQALNDVTFILIGCNKDLQNHNGYTTVTHLFAGKTSCMHLFKLFIAIWLGFNAARQIGVFIELDTYVLLLTGLRLALCL